MVNKYNNFVTKMDSNGAEKHQTSDLVPNKPINEKTNNSSRSCCDNISNAKINTKEEQWPEVQLRVKRSQTTSEKSAAQRKRSSRNRLSNRRSTGFVTPEEIDAALTFHETENL